MTLRTVHVASWNGASQLADLAIVDLLILTTFTPCATSTTTRTTRTTNDRDRGACEASCVC